ncbi:hypothetical protein GYH30_022360 [Glycine max]|nr:hypothetical protein GYH30_022360 [Glycine max]
MEVTFGIAEVRSSSIERRFVGTNDEGWQEVVVEDVVVTGEGGGLRKIKLNERKMKKWGYCHH